MEKLNLPWEPMVGKNGSVRFVGGSDPEGGRRRSGGKPSSVHPPKWTGDHLSRTPVAGRLEQPTHGSPFPVWTVRVAPRRLFGLAPIGGYRATAVTSGAVGSYPTFSPLPAETGGIFSVALSVASRRPGVTWQSTLWSSDFPRGPMGPAIPAPNLFAIER